MGHIRNSFISLMNLWLYLFVLVVLRSMCYPLFALFILATLKMSNYLRGNEIVVRRHAERLVALYPGTFSQGGK